VPRIDGYDSFPEYVIVGGLVFVPLSQPWAELKNHNRNARSLVHQHFAQTLPEEGRQIVILSNTLAHPCNFGYHGLSCLVLDRFNEVPVTNLGKLAAAVAACGEDTYSFEFLRLGGDGKELVVLDRSECKAAEPEILAQHLIAAPAMVRGQGTKGKELRPPECWAAEESSATVTENAASSPALGNVAEELAASEGPA